MKTADFLFLIISSFIFFLLRLPSLFEPYWYGDEGIYQAVAMAINKGSLLYKDIWDNKPPLLYLLYALFDSDQFAVRLVSLVFGLLSVIVFFFLTKKLFPTHEGENKIHFLITSIFALLLALPILEGNIANAENFMMPLILMAAFLIFNFFQHPRAHRVFDKVKSQKSTHSTSSGLMLSEVEASKVKTTRLAEALAKRAIQNSKFINFQLLIAGLLLGIAFLFKVVAVFDFLAFISFLLLIKLTHKLKLSLFLLIVGFLIPIIITIFYFWTKGALVDFASATFSSNIGYVAWQNKMIFPQGLLLLKITLLIIAIVLIVRKRKALSLNTTFILLWFAFLLFNAFLTQRPYTHYLITLLPSFTLMIGLIFWEKKYRKAITLFFILVFVLVLKNFNFYGKTIAYYQNFVSFLTGEKSVLSYRAFFDKRTPIDYEIATFLKSKIRKEDSTEIQPGSVFIWGNNAQVYKMVGSIPVGKYIVAYHIIDSKDGLTNTKEAIEKVKPRFIIVMPDQKPIPFKLVHYSRRIGINNVEIYERFF